MSDAINPNQPLLERAEGSSIGKILNKLECKIN